MSDKIINLLSDRKDHIFMSRMWILADTISMQEFWSYELQPMDGKHILTSEWAESYCGMYDARDYRKLFDLEDNKNYQVIFTAKLESYYCGYPTCEWDEDMDLIAFEAVEVPTDYIRSLEFDLFATQQEQQNHLTLDNTDNPSDAG